MNVNESNDPPEGKVVDRQNVHSHTWKHAARVFKEKHKPGRNTDLTEVRLLAALGFSLTVTIAL